MPPRWILFAVIAVYSTSWIKLTIAAELLNTLPVASNGWRPIVGTSKVKPYLTIDQHVDQAPKQTVSLTERDKDNKPNSISHSHKPHKPNPTGPVLISHHGSSGHHGVKPVKLVGPGGGGGSKGAGKPAVGLTKASPAPRHPVLGKLHAHMAHVHASRHKPHQAQGLREEIMAPAPSSAIGSYAFFNQGPLLKPYPGPGGVDFSNHFVFSNAHNDVVGVPAPFYKHPSQNELQPQPQPQPAVVYQDEFTRNLVPPPPRYQPHGETEASVQLHKYRPPDHGYFQNSPQNFDLEITKEKFKEYHTTLAPSNFKPSTESFLETSKYTKPKLITSSLAGYEVTENKDWTEQYPSYKPLFPTPKPKYPQIQYYQHDDTINAQFLPTPYNPDQTYPTSPTQVEVSSVYSEVSKKKVKVPTTTAYNIKEVATHFPIFTSKHPAPTQLPQTPSQSQSQLPIVPLIPTVPSLVIPLQPEEKEQEVQTEVTTKEEELMLRPTYPTRGYSHGTRKPMNRRRRPTRPSTTEQYNTEETAQSVETEKPKTHRRRRPMKYRTTEPPREPTETTTRATYRPRPTRIQPHTVTEEVFVSTNHRHRPSYPPTTEDLTILEPEPTREQEPFRELEPEPTRELQHFQEPTTAEHFEEPTELIKKKKRLRISTTTESLPVTNLNIPENLSDNVPENELDYTTVPAEEVVTIKEVYDFETEREPTTITTSTTTTTTSEPSSTKTNRLRRPIKYEVQQRPRFSVKDYRQRLNQYMSSSTTETTKHPTESTPRLRYPSRFNKLSTTTEPEDTTEISRQKFIPKEPRRKLSYTPTTGKETSETSTEKHVRSMNPRLKQLTRFRSTTEPTTTTQKVSIKPNIFNNLRRPQQLSLRNRIYNKRNLTTTTETLTDPPQTEDPRQTEENTEKNEVTIPFEIAESKIEITTQLYKEPTTEKNDVMGMGEEDDAFLQLQRISDLTSSAHKQYNTPGMFKSVSPTSRKVPSYFTIATEDPILPIEAFFPNLNQKNDKQ